MSLVSSSSSEKPQGNTLEKAIKINGKKNCEQCKKRKKPCELCTGMKQHTFISDHSRTVFSTQTARRLSSGSACETCRRRKTKCDGESPCSFCANNNIECINEKRNLLKSNNKINSEAIERIEDRLRRIEKLMTVFNPSTHAPNDRHMATRPHRHSIQGINVTKEKTELTNQYNNNRRGSPYSSPNFNSLSTSPPTSTNIMRSSSSHSSVANSMLNLTISPSTSTNQYQQQDTSTAFPLIWQIENEKNMIRHSHDFDRYVQDQQQQQPSLLPSPPNSSRSTSSLINGQEHIVNINQQYANNEWKISSNSTMPSVTDQLSKITFPSTANNYTMTNYPIYPVTPPTSRPNSHS